MEATDVNARWQAEMAEFFESGRAGPRASSGSRRCSTLSDAFAAIDLGAESGRVVCGRLDGERVRARRGPPLRQPAGAAARRRCAGTCSRSSPRRSRASRRARRRCAGVGVVLVGRRLRAARRRAPRARAAVPLPRRPHRRHDRARARARAAATSCTRRRGIQTMPINTVFQLLADEGTPALAAAERIALVPDLFNLWLTGELANEVTNASTTGLLDARTGTWARELIAPPRPAGPRRSRATRSSPGRDARRARRRARSTLVASHDTASAFVAAPLRTRARGDPVVGHVVAARPRAARAGARRAGERLQPHQRARHRRDDPPAAQRDGPVARAGVPARAGATPTTTSCTAWPPRPTRTSRCSTPTPTRSSRPTTCPRAIVAACRDGGQEPPESRGEIVRSALVSLACKYRLVLERLQRVTGREVDVVHVIGGGARNELLCGLTADVLGVPVLAGPVEATALGQRARPGARRRRGRLARARCARSPPPPPSRRPTSRATAARRSTNASSP